MTVGLAKFKVDTLAIKKAKGLVDALVERLTEVEVETFGNTLAEALVY